ncbi:MAG: glycosyltransferase family 61 protein [Acidimicrobiia bacterium]
MERLYRYVKSHSWASGLGAAVLAIGEALWAHLAGILRGRRRLIERPADVLGWDDWPTHLGVAVRIPFPEHVAHSAAPRSVYAVDPVMFREGMEQRIDPGFVASIDGGYVWRDGVVMLSSGEVIEESILVPSRNPLSPDVRLPRPIPFPGSLCVLSTSYGRGFYHWVFDSMARLAIVEAAGIEPDGFVVNYKHLPFQREWLQAMGLGPDRVHSSLELPFALADQVILTQIPGRDGLIPRYAVDFLRRKLRELSPDRDRGPARIYISRGNAASRRLANEDEVARVLSSWGFETVALETIPLAHRSRLLGDAEIFLCPDGAGLTSMLFCGPDTKVIEMLTHRQHEPFGFHLSNRLGLEYFYVLGDSGHIDIEVLEATLEMAVASLA